MGAEQKVIIIDRKPPAPGSSADEPAFVPPPVDANGLPLTPAELTARDKAKVAPKPNLLIETPDDAVAVLRSLKEAHKIDVQQATMYKQSSIGHISGEEASRRVATVETALNGAGVMFMVQASTISQKVGNLLTDLSAQMEPADLKVVANNSKVFLFDRLRPDEISWLTDQPDPKNPVKLERPVKPWDVLVAKANGWPVPPPPAPDPAPAPPVAGTTPAVPPPASGPVVPPPAAGGAAPAGSKPKVSFPKLDQPTPTADLIIKLNRDYGLTQEQMVFITGWAARDSANADLLGKVVSGADLGALGNPGQWNKSLKETFVVETIGALQRNDLAEGSNPQGTGVKSPQFNEIERNEVVAVGIRGAQEVSRTNPAETDKAKLLQLFKDSVTKLQEQ